MLLLSNGGSPAPAWTFGGNMIRRHVRPASAALTTGALAVLGLGLLSPSSASGAEGSVVKVKVSEEHVVSMVEELQPGVHKFVVRSEKHAGFQLLKPAKGYSKKEAVQDANTMFEDMKALKRFERNTELVGGVNSAPGTPAVMWTELKRGRHWAVNTSPHKMQTGQVAVFRVKGESLGGSLPDATTLTAVTGHDWLPEPTSIPTSGQLSLSNSSDANHMFGVAKLKKGMTVDDFAAWVKKVQNGKNAEPPVRFGVGFESGLLSPGRSMSMTYDVPAGKYVLMCWWPDADHHGMPHVFMGMYRGITVKAPASAR